MLKKDLQRFHQLYEKGLFNNLIGVKLNYAITKNATAFKSESDSLDAAEKMSDEYLKLNKEREGKCIELSKKDKNQDPLIVDDQYVIEGINKIKLDDWFKKFEKKNKLIFDARDKQLKEVEAIGGEKVEVQIHKISLDDISDEITGSQMKELYFMIKED